MLFFVRGSYVIFQGVPIDFQLFGFQRFRDFAGKDTITKELIYFSFWKSVRPIEKLTLQ